MILFLVSTDGHLVGLGGVLFLLCFPACHSEEISITRFEDSPAIDRLLAAAPHFVVNTDTEAETWVATTRLGLPTDSLILGRPRHMIVIGDSLYISERSGNIFSVGTDGHLSRKIGRLGKGPGEFDFLTGLQYNGSYIFVSELERIQVFTDKFEYVHSFFLPGMTTHRRFSVSPDYVFLQCPREDWLVCARSTSPPYDWIPSIGLLPVLDLPDRSGENANSMTVSPEGNRIAMAYSGFPYIFVYDDQFRHLQTIRFEGADVRNFTPVGLPDGVSKEVMEPGSFTFIGTIKFIDSRYLIARGHRTENYIFDLSENSYKLIRKVIFRPINDTEERKDVPPLDFLLHQDYLYVSSPWEEYIYGYEFDLGVGVKVSEGKSSEAF